MGLGSAGLIPLKIDVAKKNKRETHDIVLFGPLKEEFDEND